MEGVIKIKEKLRCVCFGAVVLNDKKTRFAGKTALQLARHICIIKYSKRK